MKDHLIFATSNQGKLKEVKEILKDIPKNILGLSDIGYNTEIEETEETFAGNALIKARTIHKHTGKDVFADDSGLQVIALDMEPGIYSARYAGPSRSSEDNMDKLLQKMKGIADRSARFISVIALVINGKEYLYEGIVNGHIGYDRVGEGGFGYDPIFIPYGYSRTFAEMDKQIKNSISHRYRAIERMKRDLLQ